MSEMRGERRGKRRERYYSYITASTAGRKTLLDKNSWDNSGLGTCSWTWTWTSAESGRGRYGGIYNMYCTRWAAPTTINCFRCTLHVHEMA